MAEASVGTSFHIVGDAYVDFFCFLDGDWPENGGDSRLGQPVKTYAGGSSTNTATHLKSLAKHLDKQDPVEIVLHTVLNPLDQYGQMLVKHASEHGFPIVNCRKENDCDSTTGHCIAIVSGGERSFMTHQGCVSNFHADDVDFERIVSTPSHVHVHLAGFYNIPGFWDGKLKKWLQFVRTERAKRFPSMKTVITLVTQHDATRQWDGGLDDILPLLDFAIMNDLEATSIVTRGKVESTERSFSDGDIDRWAKCFATKSPSTNIIVTRGEEGAVALRNGEIICNQSAIMVTPVDPTGAGDSFTAGFLHGLWRFSKENEAPPASNTSDQNVMWSKEAISEGLRWGCAVGKSAILIRGASVPADPSHIEEFLAQSPSAVS